jgi:N-acylneuraminate cytidylyltransferase
MINGHSVLAIIPARGGSKGIPKKNIRIMMGRPLIAWSIDAAKKSKYIDRLILSSEDEEIIRVARDWGCEAPFIRPRELSLDETPGVDPVIHAINMISGYEYGVLLQPTSPLRNADDIDNCIEQCLANNVSTCVSVVESAKSPYWMYALDDGGGMHPLIDKSVYYDRRQDLPKVYSLNGAVYVFRCEELLRHRKFVMEDTSAYVMPAERSIDIDTELDWLYFSALLQKNAGKERNGG